MARPLFSRYVIHGALERHFVVYEHIEVVVHPLRLHLTYALATALQDYFQLGKEDEVSSSRRQQDFSRTLSPTGGEELQKVRTAAHKLDISQSSLREVLAEIRIYNSQAAMTGPDSLCPLTCKTPHLDRRSCTVSNLLHRAVLASSCLRSKACLHYPRSCSVSQVLRLCSLQGAGREKALLTAAMLHVSSSGASSSSAAAGGAAGGGSRGGWFHRRGASSSSGDSQGAASEGDASEAVAGEGPRRLESAQYMRGTHATRARAHLIHTVHRFNAYTHIEIMLLP